jgi:carbonic anhydrase/acetyltransferase-like protein (isoleucine patch superfamily)
MNRFLRWLTPVDQAPRSFKMKEVGGAFIHSTAKIYGDVTLGSRCSIWCNAVIRAEANSVSIGEDTNIQDFVMIHVGMKNGAIVGAHCSITHHATLHGCIIEDNVLVGIGATIMDGCRIGANSIVAGHSFLKEGTVIPKNSIVMGTPGVVVKTRDNFISNRINAFIYARNAAAYSENNFRLWSDSAFIAEVEREDSRLRRANESD